MEDVFKTTDINTRHNAHGHEILNPTPMQPPVGYKKQPSIAETVREQVAAHYRMLADQEIDTEEEADDFDIPDDPIDQESKWENDNIPTLREARQRLSELSDLEKSYVTQSEIKKQGSPVTSTPVDPTVHD